MKKTQKDNLLEKIEEVSEYSSEPVKDYLFSKKYLVIYSTTVLRVGFYYYCNAEFKMIALSNIKDDHFVSYTCSILFIVEVLSRIFSGYITDFIHLKVIQNLIFL